MVASVTFPARENIIFDVCSMDSVETIGTALSPSKRVLCSLDPAITYYRLGSFGIFSWKVVIIFIMVGRVMVSLGRGHVLGLMGAHLSLRGQSFVWSG